jgi:alanyl aminopeptidase
MSSRLASLMLVCAIACQRSADPTSAPSPPPAKTPVAPSTVATAALAASEPIPTRRLPRDVEPLSYDLSLRVVPTEERFSGSAEVSLRLTRPRQVLWLHGKDLRVRSAQLLLPSGETLPATYAQRHDDGVASITLPRAVGPGNVKLSLSYDASLGTSEVGLYRVVDGGESYAFTQFEAIDARRCFPGFDEPAFKTPFRVSMTVKREHTAVANTLPLREEMLAGGFKRVTFAPTERLPTYLVAMAVGPLDVVTAPAIPTNAWRSRPLPLRGVAARGKGASLRTALAVTPGLVAELERYFGIAYPYDKLDLIAVPGQSGAMENAGAITFEERSLLMSANSASVEQERRVASTIAHEVAHQWFGNLVTMRWWDDIWLNEAFATWVGTKVHEQARPKDNAELKLLEWVQDAIKLDRLMSSRRIRQPIESTHDINGAFDDVTYGKGSQVLSMFERYVGAPAFQRGVRQHLQRFRFGTATLDDFLRALSEGSGKDIAPAFRSFLMQPGLPIVDVRVDCGGEKPVVRLAQSRFLPKGSTGDPRRLWSIPVCVRYETDGQVRSACTLLSQAEGTLALSERGCPAWVFPNADGAGYYLFGLSAADHEKLSRVAIHKLNVREQVALADSLYGAFESGRLSTPDVLAAFAPLASSPERSVGRRPMELVRTLRDHVVPEELAPRVEAYARRLYAARWARLGFDGARDRSPEQRVYRKELLAFLALDVRDPAVRKEALRRGFAYLGLGPDRKEHADVVSADLRETLMTVAAQEGGGKVFDLLARRLRASRDQAERLRTLRALGRAVDPTLARKALALVLDEAVAANEAAKFFEEQVPTREMRDVSWTWLQGSYDGVAARLPPTPFGQGMLPRRFEHFCTAKRGEEVGRFFAPRIEKLSGGPRNLKITQEMISLCAASAAAQRESARVFFAGMAP